MRLEMAASQVSFNIKVAKSADGNQGSDEQAARVRVDSDIS